MREFTSLAQVNEAVITCEQCPRLRQYCAAVAREKRRAFRDEDYWGKPLPGFGDPDAQVLIVGLAPAAHGGNRTGRMFTGDRSGDFLYAALYRAGWANQPTSIHRADGLILNEVYISAAGRCAPPDNKPTTDELANCRTYLVAELHLLKQAHTIIALGQIAFDSVLAALPDCGVEIFKPRPVFGHNLAYRLQHYTLIASYHPSQRNTSTKLLTSKMFDAVFARARLAL